MDYRLALTLIPLLCAACAGNEPTRDHRWFNTYQSDRSCQGNIKPIRKDPFLEGPTGRSHPF